MYTVCKRKNMYLYKRRGGERERGTNHEQRCTDFKRPSHRGCCAAVTLVFNAKLFVTWLSTHSYELPLAETGSFSIMCQWLYSASCDLCTSTQYTHTVKCTNIWSKWHTLSPSPGLLKRLQEQWTSVASDTISCVPGQPQDRPSKYGGGLGPVWTTMDDGWWIDTVDDGWLLDDGWMMQIWMMGNEPPFMRLLSGYCTT